MDPSVSSWRTRINDEIAIRDSKNPTAGHLNATPAEWSTFLAAIKHGHFDQNSG